MEWEGEDPATTSFGGSNRWIWRQFVQQCMRFSWTGLFRYFFVCLDCSVFVIILLFKIQLMGRPSSSMSYCQGIRWEDLFWDCWQSYFRHLIDGLTYFHFYWRRNDFSGFGTWIYCERLVRHVYTRIRLMVVVKIFF